MFAKYDEKNKQEKNNNSTGMERGHFNMGKSQHKCLKKSNSKLFYIIKAILMSLKGNVSFSTAKI